MHSKNPPYNSSVVSRGFPILASFFSCASFVGDIISDIDEYIYINNIMVGDSIRVHTIAYINIIVIYDVNCNTELKIIVNKFRFFK